MTIAIRSAAARHVAAGLAARFNAALPALYLAWAAPFLIALAWLTPPFQNPDEVNHYLRALQIARGELIAFRIPVSAENNVPNSGGHSDPGIIAAADPFSHLPFHPQQRVRQADFERARQASFGKDAVIGFGNTAVYPPFLYIPDVLGIWIAEFVNGKIITGLYLSRLANGIIALLISFRALTIARRTRSALAAVAMLPMTSALFVSASQDSTVISLSLLLVAVVDRIGAEERPASGGELLLIAVSAAVVGMAKPPYGVLALLPLATPFRSAGRELAAMAAISACTVAWLACVVKTASVHMNGADAELQLIHLAHHPLAIAPLAWNTARAFAVDYAREFIGVLGWLDTPLPRWFLIAAGAAVTASFLGVAASRSGPRPWLPLTVVILGSAAVFGAQYLAWTRPLAPFVDGVQGRYFIPLAPVLALALPAAPRFVRRALPWVAIVAIAFLANFAPAMVIRAIVLRYYLF